MPGKSDFGGWGETNARNKAADGSAVEQDTFLCLHQFLQTGYSALDQPVASRFALDLFHPFQLVIPQVP
ncbi:hypothetical protein [Thermoflavimicrobium dichotomicum]|uniref:hypothetical protein n=1 Tax=Thermoflavimicrobium dichotomicum TaxID=46223 RepID=UPI001FE0080B|nr:hypothetical protein [Thermoflavimicrobium dichotomicum]